MKQPQRVQTSGHRAPTSFTFLDNNLFNFIVLLIIFLLALFYYFESFFVGFQWDDWGDLAHGYHTPYMQLLAKLAPTSGDWRVVTRFFWKMNYDIFGLSPVGFHVVHFVLHIVCVFWVWLTAKTLSKSSSIALLAAFLFAMNKALITPVAWISATIDQKLLLFALPAVLFYHHYAKKYFDNKYPFWGIILITISGWMVLKSKLMGITMPLIFLGVDYFFCSANHFDFRQIKRTIIRWLSLTLPLMILILIYIPNYFKLYGDVPTSGEYGTSLSPLNIINSWCLYTASALGFRVNTGHMVGGLTGIFLLLYALVRRRKNILFGLYWYSITLLPVAILIKHHYEHHLYLPIFGLVICAADLFIDLIQVFSRLRYGRVIKAGLIAAFAVFYLTLGDPYFERYIRDAKRGWSMSQHTLASLKAQVPRLREDTTIYVFPAPPFALFDSGDSIRFLYDKWNKVKVEAMRNPKVFEQAIQKHPPSQRGMALRYSPDTFEITLLKSWPDKEN